MIRYPKTDKCPKMNTCPKRIHANYQHFIKLA
jgi:hypothetical protein